MFTRAGTRGRAAPASSALCCAIRKGQAALTARRHVSTARRSFATGGTLRAGRRCLTGLFRRLRLVEIAAADGHGRFRRVEADTYRVAALLDDLDLPLERAALHDDAAVGGREMLLRVQRDPALSGLCLVVAGEAL